MSVGKVRIDKWLWAARFFKTRTQAKEAIDGGKVRLNGIRARPSKELTPGDTLQVTRERDEMTVLVCGLSATRRSAALALELYEETATSVAKRALRAEQRRAAGAYIAADRRPDKQGRRRLRRLRDNNLD